jgi:hypothetical protein
VGFRAARLKFNGFPMQWAISLRMTMLGFVLPEQLDSIGSYRDARGCLENRVGRTTLALIDLNAKSLAEPWTSMDQSCAKGLVETIVPVQHLPKG